MCEPQSYHHVFCPSEVTESQQLDSVIQQLASEGCKVAEPGMVIRCRGQVQQDVSRTIAQVQITPGCTISLAGPESTARCTSPAALSLHHLPPTPNNGPCHLSNLCFCSSCIRPWQALQLCNPACHSRSATIPSIVVADSQQLQRHRFAYVHTCLCCDAMQSYNQPLSTHAPSCCG